MINTKIRVASPKEKLKARNLENQVYRYNEEGDMEKRCCRCHEYWPADSEFFFTQTGKGDGLSGYCKACYVENRFPTGRGSVAHQFHARAA